MSTQWTYTETEVKSKSFKSLATAQRAMNGLLRRLRTAAFRHRSGFCPRVYHARILRINTDISKPLTLTPNIVTVEVDPFTSSHTAPLIEEPSQSFQKRRAKRTFISGHLPATCCSPVTCCVGLNSISHLQIHRLHPWKCTANISPHCMGIAETPGGVRPRQVGKASGPFHLMESSL